MKKRWYPILVVLSCCGMTTASLGITFNCAGIFYGPVALEMQTGIGNVSLYLTIVAVSSAVFSPLAVKLADRVDLRLLILGGVVLFAACSVVMSYARSVWVLYVAAAFAGLAVAPTGIAMVTNVIANWFHKSMGVAIGTAMSFSGIMGAVLNPLFSALITSNGWRTVYRLEAALGIAVLIPAILFIRLKPEELGMEPFGNDDSEPIETVTRTKENDRLRAVSGKFVLVSLISVFGSFITGMASHLSGFATDAGQDAMTGAYMISAAMIGNTSSKLIVGALCDKLGGKNACIIVFTVILAGLLGLHLLPANAKLLLMLSALLLGGSYAVGAVGVPSVAKTVFGSRQMGKYFSYIASFGSLSGALSYSVIGYAFDLTGSYSIAIFGCASMAVMSVGCIWRVFQKSEACV